MRNAIKLAVGVVTMIAAFLLLKHALGNPSSLPQAIEDAYPPSFLARRGLENLGYLALILTVLFHYFANGLRIGRTVDARPVLSALVGRGIPVFLALGVAYGVVWFVAFLELGFVYYGRMEARCVLSGVRDLATLSLSGIVFSFLFAKRRHPDDSAVSREVACGSCGEILVIPCVAIGFFAFHFLQYRFAFVAAQASPYSIGGIAWLASFGLTVASTHYLFAGRSRRPFLASADFFLNVFGCNWLLYNLFYNPALAIPVTEVLLRAGAGVLGGLSGAFAFYLARRAISWCRVATPSFR